MYSVLLFLHSLIRWGVLLGGLYAITKSFLGLMRKSEFSAAENRSHIIFVIFCHTQLLLGILLYFTSPVIHEAFADFGAAMKDPRLRLYAMEHGLINIIAIGLIQTGRIVSKKAEDAGTKHKRAIIWFGIGLLLILSRIPWQYSPMFRF